MKDHTLTSKLYVTKIQQKSTVLNSVDSGEFTVERSTISHWANRFRGGCVRVENDPRPGRPRTSTDERSVKLVGQMLFKKIVVHHVKNFLEPWEQNLCKKMHNNRPQLLVTGPLIVLLLLRPYSPMSGLGLPQ